jgi:hypothetical protein
LQAFGDLRDHLVETSFHAFYGSPVVQALVGLRASDASPRNRPGVDAVYRAFVADRIDELTRNLTQGGPREAAIRALLYIRIPEGVADERGFRLLERMRESAGGDLPLADFKTMVRDQFLTLLLDERQAIEAIPGMLDADPELAARMAKTLRRLVEMLGVESEIGKSRLTEITAMFESRKKADTPKNGSSEKDRFQQVRPTKAPAAAKLHRPH